MPAYNIIYLGGPTVIIEIDGLRFMTDPTLDPAGTEYIVNNKPVYSKLKAPAINDVGKIDVVLLSHDQHKDNLDNAGRELLQKVPIILTTVTGATRLERNAKGLLTWETYHFDTASNKIIITATPARHGPAGSEKITGEVIGFLISVTGKKSFEIYLTGDTVFYSGIEEVAQRYTPQNVFIFAGAAHARGPFNLTMGTNDALDTAAAFPNATITPLHYEGWTHYTENIDMLKQAFAVLIIEGRLKFLVPVVEPELPLSD
jgi:L-ascorbate metabolism protein UlaG (beta-lactamase superfamily)